MRDPTSSFTFLNYLHTQHRLVQYINREEKVPSRKEWSAYMAWAAQRLDRYAQYGRTVTDLQPVERDGKVAYIRVLATNNETGASESVCARNVALAVGGAPVVPARFQHVYTWPQRDAGAVSRVVHSSSFLPQMAQLERILHQGPKAHADRPLQLAVVGGGQSSAEMLCYLRDRFPSADIRMLVRAPALVPSDDSPFVNSAAFDPASVSAFWKCDLAGRQVLLNEFKRTNYSVIRSDLLAQVYEHVYDQQIDFHEPYTPAQGKVTVETGVSLDTDVQLSPEGYVEIQLPTSSGKDVFDAVFLGTGFERAAHTLPFVHTLARDFSLLSKEGLAALRETERNEEATIRSAPDPDAVRAALRGITRDYRLVPHNPTYWNEGPTAASLHPAVRRCLPEGGAEVESAGTDQGPVHVYVFGCNEPTHGLSDSLMSMTAHRAHVVTASVLASTPAR